MRLKDRYLRMMRSCQQIGDDCHDYHSVVVYCSAQNLFLLLVVVSNI